MLGGRALKELSHISDRSSYSGNKEQFLEMYPEIQEAMDEHDKGVNNLNNYLEQLFKTIKESKYLLDLYLKTTDSESLKKLKDVYNNELEHYDTDEAILQRIFGSSTKQEDHLATLAEYIVNTSGDFNFSDRSTAPIWNTYRDEYLDILNYQPVSNLWSNVEAARDELLHLLDLLTDLLKKTRSALSREHGISIEAPKDVPVIYASAPYY